MHYQNNSIKSVALDTNTVAKKKKKHGRRKEETQEKRKTVALRYENKDGFTYYIINTTFNEKLVNTIITKNGKNVCACRES